MSSVPRNEIPAFPERIETVGIRHRVGGGGALAARGAVARAACGFG